MGTAKLASRINALHALQESYQRDPRSLQACISGKIQAARLLNFGGLFVAERGVPALTGGPTQARVETEF